MQLDSVERCQLVPFITMVLENKLGGCYWTNFYDHAKNKAKASLLYPL